MSQITCILDRDQQVDAKLPRNCSRSSMWNCENWPRTRWRTKRGARRSVVLQIREFLEHLAAEDAEKVEVK